MRFSLIAFLVVFSVQSFAERMEMVCFTDILGSNELAAEPQDSNQAKRTFNIKGDFKTAQWGALPFEAKIEVTEENGFEMLDGNFQILNPFLNQPESIHQVSRTYNEINILKNRLRDDTGFGMSQPGDQYAFGVHCASRPIEL